MKHIVKLTKDYTLEDGTVLRAGVEECVTLQLKRKLIEAGVADHMEEKIEKPIKRRKK